MCKTGHNNMTFTTVEQKIAWEYLEVTLCWLMEVSVNHRQH